MSERRGRGGRRAPSRSPSARRTRAPRSWPPRPRRARGARRPRPPAGRAAPGRRAARSTRRTRPCRGAECGGRPWRSRGADFTICSASASRVRYDWPIASDFRLRARACSLSAFRPKPFKGATRVRHSSGIWRSDGQQVGPVPEAEVINRLRIGEISRATLVFTAGMTNWTAAWRGAAAGERRGGRAAAASADWRRRRRTLRAARPRDQLHDHTARICSSSKSSSIRARASSPKPAG